MAEIDKQWRNVKLWLTVLPGRGICACRFCKETRSKDKNCFPPSMHGWVVLLQEIQTGCCQLKSEFKIWGSFTARQFPASNITAIFPHFFYSTEIKAKFAIPDKTCVCSRYKSRQVISLSLICLKPSSTPTNSNRVRPQVLK